MNIYIVSIKTVNLLPNFPSLPSFATEKALEKSHKKFFKKAYSSCAL